MLERHPNQGELTFGRGNLHYLKEDFCLAFQDYRQTGQLIPQRVLQAVAVALNNCPNSESPIQKRAAEELLEVNPTNKIGMFLRVNDDTAALEKMEREFKTDVQFLKHLAMAYFKQGKEKKCREYLKRATEANEKYEVLHVYQALPCLMSQDYEKAIEHFKAFLAHQPVHSPPSILYNTYFSLGECFRHS